jgi:NadR type nicotinamide-nucleotide adenylyltransferase
MNEFNNIYWKATSDMPHKVWYVGDKEYQIDLTTMFNEEAVLVDRLAENPICATMIRKNPIKHWDKIALPFKRIFSTNILICGTASEGKSVLTADLGKYFNAPYSTEYARDYMKESCIADWELESTDFMAFLDGQYNLNKKMINSSANNGLFFADSDSMVTRMYAEYYSQDKLCALTPQDFEKVSVIADEITSKCKWDKIYLLCPKGEFVDDHERFMAHSGMKEREELFTILCNNLKNSNNWDKVTILIGGYYNNFKAIINDVKEIIKNGKMD